jgi:nuclear pore complex protein Nup188
MKALARIEKSPEDDPGSELYLEVPALVDTIHRCIADLLVDSGSLAMTPVMLAWGAILFSLLQSYHERAERKDLLDHERLEKELQRPTSQRRSSAGSMVSLEVSPYDEFVRSLDVPNKPFVAHRLFTVAVDNGRAYQVLGQMAEQAGLADDGAFSTLLSWRIRATFLDLALMATPIVGYQSETFECVLSILAGNVSYWDVSEDSAVSDILMTALSDGRFLHHYLKQAVNRYPFEQAPFVHLCRALARSTADQSILPQPGLLLRALRRTPTVTIEIPSGFEEYEDFDEYSVRLTADLPLVTPLPRARRLAGGDLFVIPAGTEGRLIAEGRLVVELSHENSALALMGRLLHVFLNKSEYSYSALQSLDSDGAAATISLLATVVRTETVKGSVQTAAEVVDEAGAGLPGGDILVVVCDMLDSWLQRDEDLVDGNSLAILTACLQFLHAVLPLHPGRVLSYMARCNLLDYDGTPGKLARLTGNLDMAAPQFDFLISAVRLLSAVVDTVMTTSIRRKCGTASVSRSGRNRPDGSEDGWLLTSEKPLAKVGSAIAEAAMNVVENASTWKFKSADYPTTIMRDVIPIMNKLIIYAFGTDDMECDSRPTASLEPGARYVIDSFLSAPSSTLRFQALLSALYTGYDVGGRHLRPNQALSLAKQVIAVLEFCTTLLKVANLQDLPVDRFETQLFKSSCILARLPSVNAAYQRPALELLKALVASARRNCTEPPSLLGFLGPQAAKSFIDVLARLDEPFCAIDEVTSIWRFFSAIIRNRQQWLSNCLISGRTPREVSNSNPARVQESSSDSVFAAALKKTKLAAQQGMAEHRPMDAGTQLEMLAILDFLTSAQNFWPWTVFSILKDPECLEGLQNQLARLPGAPPKSRQNALGAAYDARQAAYIAEASAMQLYHLRHMGSAKSAAEKLVKTLDYYLRNGALVAGYNASLHMNFARNFANKYPSCSVDSFKRTSVQRRDMGDNYYYDLDRADKMLGFDAGWRGPRNNGFRAEMERANLNLSLVDAQIVGPASSLQSATR